MVRLEAQWLCGNDPAGRVSIPIWCDWKEGYFSTPIPVTSFNSYMVRLEGDAQYTNTSVCKFQFLYGAIGSFDLARQGDIKASFNSYMVRLEDVMIENVVEFMSVSIPIWCDWKFVHILDSFGKRTFQFLYGAIGRSENYLGNVGYYMVSIPIWCDWKLQRLFLIGFASRRFNSYMVRLEAYPFIFLDFRCLVSIPIWCDWKILACLFAYFHLRVSIPIWCDWKNLLLSLSIAKPWFQFLYGAIGSILPLAVQM